MTFQVSKTASFTSYTAGGFSWADQVALADTAAELAQRGVRVVLSNADSPKIHQLYRDRGFTLSVVQAQRAISASAASRQPHLRARHHQRRDPLAVRRTA